MNKQIKINQATVESNRMNLRTNETISGFIPKEHILVDSDHFSFIYLMEENDQYVYVGLDESIWSVLKEAIDQKLPAFLVSDKKEVELISFQDEMEYIINNIKGNGNYGEEMVAKVEKTFEVM
jgi:hypothetical protein